MNPPSDPARQPATVVVLLTGEADSTQAIDDVRASLSDPAMSVQAVSVDGADWFARWHHTLQGMEPGQHLLVTQPGVFLPPGWDLRLLAGLQADARVAACCASTNAAAIFSPLPADFDTRTWNGDRLDRAVCLYGDRAIVDMPCVHTLATGWRHDALAALSAPAEADQGFIPWLVRVCQDLRAEGRSVVLLDSLYVHADVSIDLRLDPVEETACRTHGVLGHIGRKLADTDPAIAAQWPRPGLSGRPVALHVMHYWGGGLDKWVRDYVRADTRFDHLLITAYRIGSHGGQRIELYADPASRQPLRVWDIAQPIRSIAATHVEFRRVLREVCDVFAVDLLMVSSLIGHTLDALDLDLPVVWVAHDFFPVCEALNPRFRGETCTACDAPRLAACRSENPAHVMFKDWSATQWLALRRRHARAMAERAIALIAPSRFVLDTLQRIEPLAARIPSHVIPHGLATVPARRVAWQAPEAGRLRIVVLGALNPNKGLTLLEPAAAGLAQFCDVLMLGCGERGLALAAELGWRAIPKYSTDMLYEEVLAFAPHAGLLLSVVPETFSYTLSELWALGVPPVATRLGAFAERIVDGEDGFLVEPEPQDLLARLQALAADAAPLERMARHLNARTPRSAADMAGDYAAVLGRIPATVAPRVAVRWSARTALTDAYQQLDRALLTYRDAYETVQQTMTEALAQTQDALAQASAALGGAQSRLAQVRAQYQQALADVRALDLRHHPWRLRQYIDRLLAFGEAVDHIAAGGQAPPEGDARTAQREGPGSA